MKDFEARGFATAERMAQAQALVDQCGAFGGMQALAGRKAKAHRGAEVAFEEGFVALPAAMLADAAAGPAGKLGRALMGAASKFGAAPSALSASGFHAPKEEPKPKAQAAGGSGWDGEDWPPDEAWGEGAGAAAAAKAPRAPRKPIDEGEGEQSLSFMVGALEKSGFGDPELAKRIEAMKGKPGSRGAKP